MTRLATLFNLHPGEGRLAGLLIALMLATALGNSIGVSGIEALFFARFGVAYLPLLYMIQGLLTLVVTLSVSAVLGGRSRNLIYTLMPVVMGGVLVGERFLAGLTWFLPVMWLLKEVMNSLMGLYVWGVASTLCDTRQAKRLFPLFNAGRIFGSVLGGLGTGALVGLIGTENLLFVWAATLGAAFLITSTLLGRAVRLTPPTGAGRKRATRRARAPGFIHEVQQGYQFVRGSALMRWVSVAAILFSALYFSLALPFSKAAAENFVSEDRIAGFLGLFNGLSTAAAFLASLFIANRLYTRFGIMNAIIALPIIYLLGFGVLAVFAAFPVLVVYKFIQMMWLSGIADSAYQAMYNAVPAERRDQVRAFIGGVPEQAGTFIAGGILIVGEQTLQSQQLYLIGLALGVACTYVTWQAGRAYSGALVAALKAGQPSLFVGGEGSFGSIQRDAKAVSVAIEGIASADPALRRVSAEILGNLSVPQATSALVRALTDSDSQVRAAALKALATARATPALLEVAACLRDPEPEVRIQAIEAVRQLAGYPQGLAAHVAPLLDDSESAVRAKAAATLLRAGAHPEAKEMLRTMAALGELDERVNALMALGEWGDEEGFQLIAMELEDTAAPAAVRRAAARAIAPCGPPATPVLVGALAADDRSVREAAAISLGQIGPPALAATAAALFDPNTEHGAVRALEFLPAQEQAESIRRFVGDKVDKATHYHALWSELGSPDSNERLALLADSLRDKAQYHALHALRALSLLGDRESLMVVIENLQSRDAAQRANALEALESVREAALVRPLLKVWETAAPARVEDAKLKILEAALEESEAWLRVCAVLAVGPGDSGSLRQKLMQMAENDSDAAVRVEARRALNGGSMDTLATLSLMERILFLRRVPLFADLSPADLKQVAAIAGEQLFGDGELLAQQGELGDEMFVIVSGEVRVLIGGDGKPEAEVARRKAGDVVGEMAIISREPRMASLVAAGDVRTLCIDQKSFEGLLRERPETSLAVMRVLCARLKEATK
jgi:HEAT repeat protein